MVNQLCMLVHIELGKGTLVPQPRISPMSNEATRI